MSNLNTNHDPCRPDRPRAAPAAGTAPDERLAGLLEEYGVAVEVIDPRTVRFQAVPVSDQCSKPRTNLLLRRTAPVGGSAYVDGDLGYHGSSQAILTALSGPCRDYWRRLNIPPLPAGFDEALCAVLDLLGSPIAGAVRAAIQSSAPGAFAPGGRSPGADAPGSVGRMLAAAGEIVSPEQAAAAHAASFRKELAGQLAVLTTRTTAPHGALLLGRSGCGRDHLMLAAAHLLLEGGRVQRVFRAAAARVAAGCLFPAEIDAALLRLLDDAAAQPNCLLLIQDLDLCMTGSPVGAALVCQALDRGVRFLATAQGEGAPAWLRGSPGLSRRLAAVVVDDPSPADVAEALSLQAGQAAVPVTPAALQTTLLLARRREAGSPAAALDLLGAALAEAAWQGHGQVGPDDIFAVRNTVWSTPNEKE
jgi:hypothetical protein